MGDVGSELQALAEREQLVQQMEEARLQAAAADEERWRLQTLVAAQPGSPAGPQELGSPRRTFRQVPAARACRKHSYTTVQLSPHVQSHSQSTGARSAAGNCSKRHTPAACDWHCQHDDTPAIACPTHEWATCRHQQLALQAEEAKAASRSLEARVLAQRQTAARQVADILAAAIPQESSTAPPTGACQAHASRLVRLRSRHSCGLRSELVCASAAG